MIADARDLTRELLTRGVQFHLDDDPDEVVHARAAGIEAFLLTRPWNQNAECGEPRVASVQQFLDITVPETEDEEELVAVGCIDKSFLLG